MHRSRQTRRSFLSQAIATGVGCAAWAGDLPEPGPYIDVHTHIGRTWNGSPGLSAEALVQWMDAHHVVKAVVLPLVSPESSSYLNLTEQVLEAARRHPKRLIPFCCIDPRTSYQGGRNGLRLMLKEYVDQGTKGFGEHKAGLRIDDSRTKALYEVCADLRLPVLFHMDEQRGMDAQGLPGLENVLKTFANVPFIGHGPGFWASIWVTRQPRIWAAIRGSVKPGGALDRLFDLYPNLWGDLSAGSGAGALERDRGFGERFLTASPIGCCSAAITSGLAKRCLSSSCLRGSIFPKRFGRKSKEAMPSVC